jgi:hypothetical protein
VIDKIAEWFLSIFYSIPPLFGADPHHARLIRAIFALFVITSIVYLIAMRPFRSFIARCVSGVRTHMARHQ